jgi:transposase-like protein
MKDAKRPATGRHRPFAPEFRAEAVRLVLSTGRPNHLVAAELGRIAEIARAPSATACFLLKSAPSFQHQTKPMAARARRSN